MNHKTSLEVTDHRGTCVVFGAMMFEMITRRSKLPSAKVIKPETTMQQQANAQSKAKYIFRTESP